MEKQTKLLPKKIRERRFLLVLPLLVIPFLTLFFRVLGGGKGEEVKGNTVKKEGLNLRLPETNSPETTLLDKMAYYNRAAADSIKRHGLANRDPGLRDSVRIGGENIYLPSGPVLSVSGGLNRSLYGSDPNTEKIYQRLADIKGEMDRSVQSYPQQKNPSPDYPGYRSSFTTAGGEVDRLERMMHTVSHKQEADEDPELTQLSGMLDKVLEIQHPQRSSEKNVTPIDSGSRQVLTVSTGGDATPVTVLDGLSSLPENSGFYGLEAGVADRQIPSAIMAVIHETQTVVSGAMVKLRLLDAIRINGAVLAKDNFLFGTAALSGERLQIKISSIRQGKELYPVDLTVYDLDGQPGIYVPGSITGDALRLSADRSVQGLGSLSLGTSVAAQAAGAGVDAAKTLFSKKARLAKVSLPAGYQVLLHDNKQRQN